MILMDWLFPLAFKPTGPFHLCRSADKSPCDLDSEPVVLIVLRDAKKRAFRLLFFGCFTWIGYSHWLLSQRVPFISAARPINRRATSIPNRWFSSCFATQKKKSLPALIFWLLHMDWLFPLAFKPTGPFHLSRPADKSALHQRLGQKQYSRL